LPANNVILTDPVTATRIRIIKGNIYTALTTVCINYIDQPTGRYRGKTALQHHIQTATIRPNHYLSKNPAPLQPASRAGWPARTRAATALRLSGADNNGVCDTAAPSSRTDAPQEENHDRVTEE